MVRYTHLAYPQTPSFNNYHVRGTSSIHNHADHGESHGVGIGHNNQILKESYIYLDSDKATKKLDDSYEFMLTSSINCVGLEKTYIYLKQFSAVNNMHMVDDSSFFIKMADNTVQYQRTFDAGSFENIDTLISALNAKFCPDKDMTITSVNEPHSSDDNKPVPFVRFSYNAHTSIVTAESLTGVNFTVGGKIFDLIKFDNAISGITHIFHSTEPVDINAYCADAYLSCEQLDNNQYSLHNIPSVLYKIPLVCNYGEYLQHEIELPLQPKELSQKNVSKLTFKLFNNIGESWTSCIRFNMTLCVQIRSPVINYRDNYWTEANLSNFLEQEQLSKNPPLPVVKCPEFFI